MRILEQALRVYCAPTDLARTISFYEAIQQVRCERTVEIGKTDITAAKVGGVLILASSEARLAALLHVRAVFYVEALDEFLPWLEAQGSQCLRAPGSVAGGRNATVRHPDGLVVEYFEPARGL